MILLLRIKGINSAIYKINKYIIIFIYVPGVKDNSIKVLYYIRREIHFIGDLKAKILISNDIIGLEKIVIDINNNKVYVRSYEITVLIIIY